MRRAWLVAALAGCAARGDRAALARAPSSSAGVEVTCVEGGDSRATDDEVGRLAAQLRKTDPTATGELEVRRVVREDLDGDGQGDAAFAVAAGDLDALLVETSALPGLRLLQFADGEPLDLLGTFDVDARQPGRELIVRAAGPRGASLELVRATGEAVARARCAAP